MKFIIGIIIMVLIAFCIFFYLGLEKKPTNYLTDVIVEYGSITEQNEISDARDIIVKKVVIEKEAIDMKISNRIDAMVEEFKSINSEKRTISNLNISYIIVLCNVYKVNDNLIGIEIVSTTKNQLDEKESKKIDVYNYRLDTETEVILSDLFIDGYDRKIDTVELGNKYILESKSINFINPVGSKQSVEYSYLKEYAKSELLDADNYQISKYEYDKIMGNDIDPKTKMIAITFDDGPHKSNTKEIIDILNKYNSSATFFLLGSNVQNYPNIVKMISENGNEIASHTWSHSDLTKLKEEEILNEINKTSDAIYNASGVRPKLVRPPYGAINDSVKEIVKFPLIMWNIDSLDWKSRDPEIIVPLVLEDVKDGDIILLHDIHETTISATELIIEQLKKDGYELVTVSELMKARGYEDHEVVYSIR